MNLATGRAANVGAVMFSAPHRNQKLVRLSQTINQLTHRHHCLETNQPEQHPVMTIQICEVPLHVSTASSIGTGKRIGISCYSLHYCVRKCSTEVPAFICINCDLVNGS